jgi:glycosyltransferase involved in cell wall biosynthesis
MPTVSVIIPTYNRAYCILRAIQSVLDQTYNDFEIIIVDNNSTDNTNELVGNINDERIKFIKINNNGVIAASRNLGIKMASGYYLAFLDSDDWWTPKKLEKSIKVLESGADIVYHNLYITKDNAEAKFIYRKAKTRQLREPVYSDLLENGNAINTSSVVVKKKLMLTIGGFSEDPDLIAAEDYDAWLRLSKHTNKFKKIVNTLGFYNESNDSISSVNKKINNINKIRSLYLNHSTERFTNPTWIYYELALCYLMLKEKAKYRKYITYVLDNGSLFEKIKILNIFIKYMLSTKSV